MISIVPIVNNVKKNRMSPFLARGWVKGKNVVESGKRKIDSTGQEMCTSSGGVRMIDDCVQAACQMHSKILK